MVPGLAGPQRKSSIVFILRDCSFLSNQFLMADLSDLYNMNMAQIEKWPGCEHFLTVLYFYRAPQGVLPTSDTQKQPSGYSIPQSIYLLVFPSKF